MGVYLWNCFLLFKKTNRKWANLHLYPTLRLIEDILKNKNTFRKVAYCCDPESHMYNCFVFFPHYLQFVPCIGTNWRIGPEAFLKALPPVGSSFFLFLPCSTSCWLSWKCEKDLLLCILYYFDFIFSCLLKWKSRGLVNLVQICVHKTWHEFVWKREKMCLPFQYALKCAWNTGELSTGELKTFDCKKQITRTWLAQKKKKLTHWCTDVFVLTTLICLNRNNYNHITWL